MEFILSLLPGERLTPAETALLKGVRELTDSFGAYILESENRDDVLTRVDAVLEDPQFHEALLRFSTQAAEEGFDAVEALDEASGRDIASSRLAHALGPAALPALRQFDAHVIEIARCIKPWLVVLPSGAASGIPANIGDDPLAFVSSPDVPVPMAEALLAMLRLCALLFAAGSVAFKESSAERWLGLAIAELLARNSRRMLAFVAALPGSDVPVSLLPPEERLDLSALAGTARAVREAYVRFNTAAERSGEPVFPASS
ncbi:hypothetical protein [Cystobacter fuscus]|uniref:hypothetical protein n=1 Tax=Cystobacter fuscus TaxID=43 RepID=UPI0012FDB9E2|nr:hypothetical protein [Cystobacter fuscus]